MNEEAPHSIEAEQSVLGCLLLDNQAWDKVSEILSAEDFYVSSHKIIFEQVTKLVNASQSADVVTVYDAIRSAGKEEKTGGFVYLNELATGIYSNASLVKYAQIVREKSMLRRLLCLGNELTHLASHPQGKDTKTILDEAESKIFRLAEYGAKARAGYQELQPVLNDVLMLIEELNERKDESGCTGLATGFTDLDNKTSGLQNGDLIIVAGRPSMGKTSFSMNIAENVAIEVGKSVAVFSMEMRATQLGLRMVGSVGKIDQQRLRRGQLNEYDWPRLTNAIHKMQNAKIFIDEAPSLSVVDLRARCRRMNKECGQLGLVVIDYLQLMSSSSKAENRTAELSAITRGLKSLAKELNCPIIALSQLNRALEQRADKRPIMSDLRESGAIEQDADLILFIYRDEVYNKDSIDRGFAEIIISKQRNGPIGTVRLSFEGSFTKFDNFSCND